MKVTILGSEGQIGAYLSEYLTKKGHEVTGVDVVYGPENDLRVTPSTYIESKIENLEWDMIGKINGVVHLAAQTSVPASIKDFKNPDGNILKLIFFSVIVGGGSSCKSWLQYKHNQSCNLQYFSRTFFLIFGDNFV